MPIHGVCIGELFVTDQIRRPRFKKLTQGGHGQRRDRGESRGRRLTHCARDDRHLGVPKKAGSITESIHLPRPVSQP
jgi:hypothetical protein